MQIGEFCDFNWSSYRPPVFKGEVTPGGAGLGVPGAATGGGSGSGRALDTRTAARLVNIVTWKGREKMQSADGSSLVRRKGSGFEDCQICALLSRCDKRHFPVDCPL